MPLFELFGDAKRKPRATHEKPTSISADQSFPPENELVELVWQNGQVMMQGQSSIAKKNHSPYSPYSLPKKDKDPSSGPHSGSSEKLRTLDSSMNEFHMSAPLGEMCLSGDEDVVPWFDYPIDETPQNDFCSDLLPELSGVTANEPSEEDFNATKRGGYSNHVNRDSNISSLYSSLNRENSSKSSLAAVSEAMRLRTSCGPAGQTQFPSLRPRQASENTGTSTSNRGLSRDPRQVENLAVGFSGEKLMKQNPGPSTNHNSFLNFSHFSRPAALYKSTIGNNCVVADSGPSNLERAGFTQKDSFPDVKTVKSNSGPMRGIGSDCQFVEKQATETASLEAKPTKELPFKESEGIRQEYAANGDEKNNNSSCANMSKEPVDAVQPVVASSVCSGNGVDSLSDDPPSNLKRKGCSSDCDSEAPSEDVEEDSVTLRKSTSARGSGSKRSRAADVHNLSERRRRDRINEKMRALQELIPNSNKVDKASMLDEAIDYLKTLQLQVQIMSMGAGLCMPPMMLPAHMAQFSPMSAGMAAGLGFRMGVVNQNGGQTACPMLQFPPMQGAHFPSPIMSQHQALYGMPASNSTVMGLPSQGLPLSMPLVPPLVPFPGGSHLRPPAGLNANILAGLVDTNAAFGSSSKEIAGNINGASCSVNHISSQVRNGGFDQPEGRAITSATAQRDDTEPSKAVREEKPA